MVGVGQKHRKNTLWNLNICIKKLHRKSLLPLANRGTDKNGERKKPNEPKKKSAALWKTEEKKTDVL